MKGECAFAGGSANNVEHAQLVVVLLHMVLMLRKPVTFLRTTRNQVNMVKGSKRHSVVVQESVALLKKVLTTRNKVNTVKVH